MSKEMHERAMEYLGKKPFSERDSYCREAILSIDYRYLNIENVLLLEEIYKKSKDVSVRNSILKSLYHSESLQLKEFFLAAYKKERYLDMKLVAIRGYAKYTTEDEIEPLIKHFMKLLKKRPEITPYNYQEYEYLRSACNLPFLIKKYGYPCFKEALEQVERQYNDMPEAFKGHYTFDEDGNYIALRTPDETRKMIVEFFEKQRH